MPRRSAHDGIAPRPVPRRALSRGVLFLLAAAFGGTAGVQVFLAGTMSEWWPAVLAGALAVAALWCLVTAVTWDDRHGHP
ncbi:hypothetical protein [Saccharomonospora saliphila]|uniref:hypothetical protein n=1 Tax=Saccharomonospora saliphila TaxID=369829 RepID=UPI0006624430|nr:hypothetical protein [Saccharomonospora saliphila]